MYEGTVTSQLRPIVTMLTDALLKDFAPMYEFFRVNEVTGRPTWERKDDEFHRTVVDEQGLQEDVHNWLLGLEAEMETESDLQYARMVSHMIRKNRGWSVLLAGRVAKHLS